MGESELGIKSIVSKILNALSWIVSALIVLGLGLAILAGAIWLFGGSSPRQEPWNPVQGYSRDGEWCEYGVSPLTIQPDGHKIGGWCYAPCAPNCGSDEDLDPIETDGQYGRW